MASKSNSNQLKESTAKALSYAPFIGLIAAIVLFLVDTRKSVKWYAVQSIALNIAGFLLSTFVPFIGWLAGIAILVLNVVIFIKLYNGEEFKLPLAKDVADNFVK